MSIIFYWLFSHPNYSLIRIHIDILTIYVIGLIPILNLSPLSVLYDSNSTIIFLIIGFILISLSYYNRIIT